MAGVFISLVIFFFLLFVYSLWERTFFKRRGIFSVPYYVPFLGHLARVVIHKEHLKDAAEKTYWAYPKQRYVGFRQLVDPLIMLRDLNLIKQVFIKDAEFFQNRLTRVDEKLDPIFGAHLVALQGKKWRDMRSTLSPAFSSSKMKGMLPFVEECALQVVDYFRGEVQRSDRKVEFIEIELKEVFKRYANDVIASAAFGLKVNSLQEKNNRFFLMGKSTSNFSGWQLLRFLFAVSIPSVMRHLRIPLFPEKVRDFYRGIILNTMAEREERGIFRADMIQLLMQAKKGTLAHDEDDNAREGFSVVKESAVGKGKVVTKWSDDEIVAQAVLFNLAGFNTTSNLLCFMAHELLVHPEVQARLTEEVDVVARKNGGTLMYEDLLDMNYMDMVVSEVLRKWPPFVLVDRKCVKSYWLPPSSDSSQKKYLVRPGEGVQIPVFSIHHDPQYFKDPYKFDPERFSEERKSEIKPGSFIPFGVGPRSCIGSRFALMEVKAVMFHVLRNFNFVPSPNTQIPLKIKNDMFTLTSETGFCVGLSPRT